MLSYGELGTLLINMTDTHTYSVTVDSGTPNTPELAITVRGSLAAAELVKYCKISCSVPCGYIFSVLFTLRPFFNSATGNYRDY